MLLYVLVTAFDINECPLMNATFLQAAYASLETLPINDCFSMPCQNQGVCDLVEFGYVCQCSPGYSGNAMNLFVFACRRMYSIDMLKQS